MKTVFFHFLVIVREKYKNEQKKIMVQLKNFNTIYVLYSEIDGGETDS